MRKFFSVWVLLLAAALPVSVHGAQPVENVLTGLKNAVQQVQPRQTGPTYSLHGFETPTIPGQQNPNWLVKVSATEDIPANYYTLKAELQSATGAPLTKFPDSAIPATSKNMDRILSSPLDKKTGAKQIRFSVVRYDGQVMVTRSFNLPTAAGALAGAHHDIPQAVSEMEQADLTERLSLAFDDQGRLVVENRGETTLRPTLRADADFVAGAGKRIPLSCPSPLTLKPGTKVVCSLQDSSKYLSCPTLQEFSGTLVSPSGQSYHAVRSFDPADLLAGDITITYAEARALHTKGLGYYRADYSFRLNVPNISVRTGTELVVTYQARVRDASDIWKIERSDTVTYDGRGYLDFSGSIEPGPSDKGLPNKRLEIKVTSIKTADRRYCGNTSLEMLERSQSTTTDITKSN